MSITFRAKTKQGWTVNAPFEAFTFPGGEAHIKVREDSTEYEYQIADLRGADSHDLFTLVMWAEAAAERGEKTVVILPYVPGARADRGTPFAAGVYASFLTELVAPDQIIILDPHSETMPLAIMAGRQRLNIFPFERIIRRELQDGARDNRPMPYVGVIAPDKGAITRASRAAQVMGVPVYKAEKTRDFETGELTGFTCEPLPETGKLLIVDDICDGGGTFIGLAQATGIERSRLDLWVTHGIFSKGIAELTYYFDHIYTTDSWGTTEADQNLTVIPVLPYLTGEINV